MCKIDSVMEVSNCVLPDEKLWDIPNSQKLIIKTKNDIASEVKLTEWGEQKTEQATKVETNMKWFDI